MKEYVKWEQVDRYCEKVFEKYKSKKLTGVYGFPRGGLVLAVILSNKFNIPLLTSPANGCLIVDDICDSGETLLHYQKNSSGLKINNYHITTMYFKPGALIVPEFYLFEKQENWIVFPWEV